tara:strand:- start:73 stop:735 length:663 start_codon:yes stop_codon:yes gene_type:complete
VSEYNIRSNIQKKVAKSLVSLLPSIRKPKILEIGCGTGFLTELVLEKYPDGVIDATDISTNMLSLCKKRLNKHNLRIFEMDGEYPKNISNSYDLIISSMVFQWFEKPIETLNKLNKIGPVYYSTIGNKNFIEWKTVLKKNNFSSSIFEEPLWPGVIKDEFIRSSYPNAISFLRMLKKTGISTSQINHVQLSTPQLKKITRIFDSRLEKIITWHLVYGGLD